MKKKVIVFATFLLIIIAITGVSYSYLKAERQSEGNNTITLSTLDVVLLTDISNVTLDNAVPVLDEVGLTNQSVTFQIKNDAQELASYKVSLVDGTTKSTVINNDVRYQLKRTDETSGTTETLEIKNLDATGLIDTGTITVGQIYTYELIMWIDYNSNPNGLTFVKNILVEGMQVASLDKSGANYPELLDNMLPVYYDKTSDTEGVWRVADSKNLDSNYQWFDYDNFMWANAVTVKETGTKTREEYLNALAGTEVAMEDITTMWVWIPRYKYVIFNGNNGVSNEQEIKVVFEHGIDKTGTVSCVDNIQISDSSSFSETCTDTINGSIINNKSTYTHPAFTFGEEELTGFWYAKFEMSTDDTTCLSSQSDANCNKTGLNVLVKPNEQSLRYISVSNMFVNIRNMEQYNNIHGFIQSESATTSSSQTGEITNDNNSYDIHMQKNMEWGAVSYLAYSKYGKYGNELYTGTYKRPYKNNYYTSSYIYKTGYSGYTYNASYSTTDTVLYNDLTDLGSGQGYKGAGASTTGNIYGVYDMNGGGSESVMGNMANTSGNFYSGSSGFSSSPLEKYYNMYSYSTSSNGEASITRSKLGDGVKETTKAFTSSGGSWEESYRDMIYTDYPWFLKMSYANGSSQFGLFSSSYGSGSSHGEYTTRPVLAIFRNFSWIE